MRGASVLVFLGLCGHWAIAQFLNNKPFPTYSLENMPDTEFSCRDKILGGYYADQETQCQMFHICVKVAGVGVQDFRFLCPNGTAFDQDHQICADWEDVDCDASTLYYSSDNFDLYRIGSGFESKALKYGEDEETFALQRAETGDHRLNREHQSNSVNQQKQATYSGRARTPVNRNNNNNNNNQNNNNNNNNNEKDIFKGSSSSNFFNNRNNGKERDEDYDENVNVNQDRDFEQRRKVVRNKIRRPVQRQNQNAESNTNRGNNNNNQNSEYNNRGNNNNQNVESNTNRGNNNNNQNAEYNNRGNNNNQNAEYNNRGNNNNQNVESNSNRGNKNNQNVDYNNRGNNNNNQNAEYNNRGNNNNQNADYNRNNNQNAENNRKTTSDYNRRNQNDYTTKPAPKADFDPTKRPSFINNFAGSSYIPTTTLKPSSTTNEQITTFTPISYRTRPAQRTREYDSPSPTYTISTPAPFKQTQQYNPPPVRATTSTENYPQQKLRTTQEPVKPKQTTFTQNYESTKVKYEKTENYPSNNPQYFEKKPTTPLRQHQQQSTSGVTTQAAPRSFATFPTIPTTFAPKTSAAYAQLAQQTKQQIAKLSTKAAPFTQYTPTVPKVASTTPIARSSRYDETQYDDGSYNPKYDYDADRREDEFLKTAHSQNIAASRNEFAKATTKQQQLQQQAQRTTAYDSPRPFSVTATTPTAQPPREREQTQKTTPKNGQTQNLNGNQNNQAAVKANLNPKKTKDVSYDYAYYDTSVGGEPDYDVNTEIKKSTVKN